MKKVEPALQPDQALLAKLAALGDNSSVVLEGTKVISEGLGDFAKGWHNMAKTGPAGRDYTIKMAWMADRQRAFFCGANHQSPHRFNDAWEYDLAANTWVLLYVPDYNDCGKVGDYDKQTLEIKDGWLRTKKGGPGHPAHTWWGLTYNPETKSVLWFCAWPSYRLKEKLEAIGAKPEDLYKGPPVWTFLPAERKWEPLPTAQPWPRSVFGASLEYVPELKGAVWQYGGESWLLDDAKKSWKQLPASKTGLPIETLVCYDPGRKLLIAQRGASEKTPAKTWHCSLAGGAPAGWEVAVDGGEQPIGHDARSLMYFDPVGKVALQYECGDKAMWAYDSDAKKWTKLAPQGPPPPFEKERVVGYLDPARNVFAVIGYGKVWCYRYKKAS
ncbi:MAG TPA: hypothetical protein PK280_21265 [Planctomycetota bacterium]|nr:hypothetical protein [Planctomycetota bacterium]